jgi:hypothetical protein
LTIISATDVWATGYYYDGSGYPTLTLHWNGSAWSTVSSPSPTNSNTLEGAGATSSIDVWAVGSFYDGTLSRTLIERWNGTAWNVVPSP